MLLWTDSVNQVSYISISYAFPCFQMIFFFRIRQENKVVYPLTWPTLIFCADPAVFFSGNNIDIEHQEKFCSCLVCSGLTSLSIFFSVISRRCLVATGSSMLTFIVLPHWSIMPRDTWHDTIPSHIILTLQGWPVLALHCNSEGQERSS